MNKPNVGDMVYVRSQMSSPRHGERAQFLYDWRKVLKVGRKYFTVETGSYGDEKFHLDSWMLVDQHNIFINGRGKWAFPTEAECSDFEFRLALVDETVKLANKATHVSLSRLPTSDLQQIWGILNAG